MVTDLEGRHQRRFIDLDYDTRFYVMPTPPFTPVETVSVKKVVEELLEHLGLELEMLPSSKPQIVLKKKEEE